MYRRATARFIAMVAIGGCDTSTDSHTLFQRMQCENEADRYASRALSIRDPISTCSVHVEVTGRGPVWNEHCECVAHAMGSSDPTALVHMKCWPANGCWQE
jgi:hypothetical protein